MGGRARSDRTEVGEEAWDFVDWFADWFLNNVYTLCGSEVVTKDCHLVALAVDPSSLFLGYVAVPPSGASL